MEFTTIRMKICRIVYPSHQVEVDLLADTDVLYSVLPSQTLEPIGVEEDGEEKFIFADGTEIQRKMGSVMFIFEGKRRPSPVAFGEKGDKALLGVVTLEALGLEVDPVTRTLKPLPHYIMPLSTI